MTIPSIVAISWSTSTKTRGRQRKFFASNVVCFLQRDSAVSYHLLLRVLYVCCYLACVCVWESQYTVCLSKSSWWWGWEVSWMKVPHLSLGLSACYQVSLQLPSPTCFPASARPLPRTHSHTKAADKSEMKRESWARKEMITDTAPYVLQSKLVLKWWIKCCIHFHGISSYSDAIFTTV